MKVQIYSSVEGDTSFTNVTRISALGTGWKRTPLRRLIIPAVGTAMLGLGCTSSAIAHAASVGGEVRDFAEQTPEMAHVSVAEESDNEAIIVTARRREESLQDVPISISAMSGDMMESRGVDGLAELDSFIPGFKTSVDSAGQGGGTNIGRPSYTIRGLSGGDGSIGQEPAVGLYIDNVYLPRTDVVFFDLMDVERVEVLKGPQGTLFGRNTTGGAIQIITKNPTDKFEGNVTARVGNYGRVNLGAVINVPVVGDVLKARFWVQSNHMNGFYDNLYPGTQGKLPTDNMFGIGGTIEIHPTPTLRWVIKADYRHADFRTVQNRALFVSSPSAAASEIARVTNGTGSIFSGSYPIVPRDKVNVDQEGLYNWTLKGISSVLTFTAAPWMDVRLISAYRKQDALLQGDADGLPWLIFNSDQTTNQNQHSQELHFLGSLFEGRLDYLFGAFYFRENADDPNKQTAFPSLNPVNPIYNLRHAENESKSAFMQISAKIPGAERLKFTAGARYTEDKKRFQTRNFSGDFSTQSQAQGFTTPQKFVFADSSGRWRRCDQFTVDVDRPGECIITKNDTYSAWSYLLSLDYKLIDQGGQNVLVYTSYSRGFKSGGRNVRDTRAGGFGPEFVRSVEGGLKTSWLSGDLVVNLAGYYSKYDDAQLVVIQTNPVTNLPVPVVQNAGKARIWGFEFEGHAVLRPEILTSSDEVTLAGTVAYTNPKYTEFSDFAGPGGTMRNRTGEKFTYVPDWTYSLGLGYAVPLDGDGTELKARIDWAWQSRQYFESVPDSKTSQGSYGLLNGRLEAKFPDPNIVVAIWGRNLLDKDYFTNLLDQRGSTGTIVGLFGNPRTYGVDVSFKF